MRIGLGILSVLAAVGTAHADAPDDPRAAQAVDIFANLCVTTVAGVDTTPIRNGDYFMTELEPDLARELLDGRTNHTLRSITGLSSGAMMLMHYEPSGMCVTQVGEADEAAMLARFRAVVDRTALALHVDAEAQPIKRRKLEGLDTTYSSWRLKSPKGDIMLAITTYPEPRFRIQHMMTVSYVR
ncbi:hypothetical protein O4H52_13345 [Sphingomonadaceae bacterium G21617-S1]|nr:hypothetical protein [Sphingomonadaceae bacterium G21617-S1]